VKLKRKRAHCCNPRCCEAVEYVFPKPLLCEACRLMLQAASALGALIGWLVA